MRRTLDCERGGQERGGGRGWMPALRSGVGQDGCAGGLQRRTAQPTGSHGGGAGAPCCRSPRSCTGCRWRLHGSRGAAAVGWVSIVHRPSMRGDGGSAASCSSAGRRAAVGVRWSGVGSSNQAPRPNGAHAKDGDWCSWSRHPSAVRCSRRVQARATGARTPPPQTKRGLRPRPVPARTRLRQLLADAAALDQLVEEGQHARRLPGLPLHALQRRHLLRALARQLAAVGGGRVGGRVPGQQGRQVDGGGLLRGG